MAIERPLSRMRGRWTFIKTFQLSMMCQGGLVMVLESVRLIEGSPNGTVKTAASHVIGWNWDGRDKTRLLGFLLIAKVR